MSNQNNYSWRHVLHLFPFYQTQSQTDFQEFFSKQSGLGNTSYALIEAEEETVTLATILLLSCLGTLVCFAGNFKGLTREISMLGYRVNSVEPGPSGPKAGNRLFDLHSIKIKLIKERGSISKYLLSTTQLG